MRICPAVLWFALYSHLPFSTQGSPGWKKNQRDFTHQNPSCTKPQPSHLIQLQGSLVLPPHPAGSFLLPSRDSSALADCPGVQGSTRVLPPCVTRVPSLGQLSSRARLTLQGSTKVPPPCVTRVPSCGAAVPLHSNTSPGTDLFPGQVQEGLQAATPLPAEGQRSTDRDKGTWPSSGFFPWSLQCPDLLQTPFPSRTRPQKPRSAWSGGHEAHFGSLPCLFFSC